MVKNYLKVDTTTDDDLIDVLIHSARKQVEIELGGTCIVKRTVTQKQTGGVEKIELLRQPCNSIASITFFEEFDSTGELISASDYRFSDGFLYHKNGYWKLGRESNGYVIVYNAGEVDDTGQTAENCNQVYRTVMLRIIAYLYEIREQYMTSINEGNLSINYDQKMRNEINLLLMPFHQGRAVF